jgi:Abortive infection alpha
MLCPSSSHQSPLGDDSLIPISDEQAKLGQELLKAVRDGSGYFADILGDLPKDLLGLLVSDRVKAKRIEKIAMLWERTRERLRDRGMVDPEPPSLKYAIPILEAAADEENEELQDLWSRLLAAAMDPNRRDAMRQSFIQVVKQMDPMDALVLKAIPRDFQTAIYHEAIASKLNCSTDDVQVSFDHLLALDCIVLGDRSYLKAFGTLLMNVLSG